MPTLGNVLPSPPPWHSESGWHTVTLIIDKGLCCLTNLQLERLGGGASGKPDSPVGRTEPLRPLNTGVGEGLGRQV